MKYIPIVVLLLLLSSRTHAQDFSSILQSIEQHSTRLEAAHSEAEAGKADASLMTTLANPEVGFNYLFGADGIGNRWDINVSQSFDFPTVISQKRRMAQETRRVCDLRYLSERQQLLVAARKLCIEVVYCNAMMEHLGHDLEETRAMAEAYETLYEKGEATAVDRNKAHQSVLVFEAEHREFLTMKENLLAELSYLNGGQVVDIQDSVFVHTTLSVDFDQWLKENLALHPDMQLAEGQLRASEQALKTARSKWAPGIRIGYMGEFAHADKYQGPTIGLSLPLWGTKREVRAARLHLEASQKARDDERAYLQTQLSGVYRDALQLQQTYLQYRQHLTACDNTSLLQKQLESGQITLLTYLQERQYVHEMHERLLTAERDLELRRAELVFTEYE